MKNLKLYLSGIAMFALLFTSCSKDEDPSRIDGGEKATLSFGTMLNDLVNSKASVKQSLDEIPACVDDAPAYVHVVLSGAESVGTMEDPVQITVNPNPFDEDGDGQEEYFTEESSDLELTPGNYSLDYFAVYSAEDELIWIAPATGGDLADFVDNPLPLDINLGAGVKKYVDVEVLCFDDRMVNEYGYLFFDIHENEAIEFCIFGNFCPPSGRHYPAAFSVDIWVYEDGARGTQLYDDLANTVELNDDGDYAATPLCIALPDRDGDDNYYVEITLLSSDAYGNIEERVIREGVISDQEVRGFFDGENNLDYFHFREGCDSDEEPPIFQTPEDEAVYYKACLTPENGSEAFGFAYFKLEGNTLRSTVLATNMETGNKPHPQHIHANASCDDSGAPIFSLNLADDSWPTASDAGNSMGSLVYNRIFELSGEQLSSIQPIEDRTVNLHGMTVDGEYQAGLVVACGPVDLQELGD